MVHNGHMTTTDAREIDHDEAFALLERTDRRNNFRGIGRNAGPANLDATSLRLALEILDRSDKRILRPATAVGFSVLELRNAGFGWLSYFVWTGSNDDERPAEWP